MDNLFFYSTLTSKVLEDSKCVCEDYKFSYFLNSKSYVLQESVHKNIIKIEDEIWSIEKDGLHIERAISFGTPQALYGKYGIAPKDADIGVCIIWTNKALNQMGYIIGDEVLQNSSMTYVLKHDFQPGEIKGSLYFDTVLYIKKAAANVLVDEDNLINEAGVIVGTIDTWILELESLYMGFPVKTVNDKSQPLWWLETQEWEAPLIDVFSEENLCICLNEAHKDCPKAEEKIKNITLLSEILSTAYFIIIRKLISEGYKNAVIEGCGIEPDSICAAMHYFYKNSDPMLLLDSDERLLKSISSNINRILQGGGDE